MVLIRIGNRKQFCRKEAKSKSHSKESVALITISRNVWALGRDRRH